MTGNGTETYLQKSREITSYELIFLGGFKPFGTTGQCTVLAEPRPGFLFYPFSYRFRLCHDLANQFWSQSNKADNEASSPICQPGTSHKIITSSQPTSMTNYNWHHTDNVSLHHMFSRILKLNCLLICY